MKLSKYFTLEEMTVSDYSVRNGIDNTPPDECLENLKDLCVMVLDPLREKLGKPIHVNSGYRNPEVNKAIGGAENSQHKDGQAADIVVDGMTADEVFKVASELMLFDQLIQEFDRWVHISYRPNVRRQKLWAVKEDGKTVYKKTDPKGNM